MTEYVVLLIGDDERWWTETSEEEKKAAFALHGRFSRRAGGARATASPAAPSCRRSSQARTVAPHSTP